MRASPSRNQWAWMEPLYAWRVSRSVRWLSRRKLVSAIWIMISFVCFFVLVGTADGSRVQLVGAFVFYWAALSVGYHAMFHEERSEGRPHDVFE